MPSQVAPGWPSMMASAARMASRRACHASTPPTGSCVSSAPVAVTSQNQSPPSRRGASLRGRAAGCAEAPAGSVHNPPGHLQLAA